LYLAASSPEVEVVAFKPLPLFAKETLCFQVELALILSQQVITVVDGDRCLEQLLQVLQ
jgi:hypothetical protein